MNRTRLGRTRMLRVAAATAAAAALAGSVQLVTASSASAAVSRVVQGHSISDSTTARKVAVATCPVGTRVFGGGGDIVGGGHGVALTALKPVSALVLGRFRDSYVAVAEADPAGYRGTWSVYAYAVCGTASNVSIRRATLAGSARSDRVQTYVNCPSGTAPLGMGAEISGGRGHVVLNKMLANRTRNAFGQLVGWASAAAFVTERGYPGPYSLTSYAVCATPLYRLSYRFADSVNNAVNDKSALVACPSGSRSYGAGGYVSYQTGRLHFDRIVPSGSAWQDADVEVRSDQSGFGYSWFTEVEAICAA